MLHAELNLKARKKKYSKLHCSNMTIKTIALQSVVISRGLLDSGRGWQSTWQSSAWCTKRPIYNSCTGGHAPALAQSASQFVCCSLTTQRHLITSTTTLSSRNWNAAYSRCIGRVVRGQPHECKQQENKGPLLHHSARSRRSLLMTGNLVQRVTQLGLCSEIFGVKFPEIYSNLSGNLLITYVNQLFPSQTLQVML